MPESTTIIRYLGEPVTKPLINKNPEHIRLEKLKKKSDKGVGSLSFKDLQDLVRLTTNPPVVNLPSGRDVVQVDDKGDVIRKFPTAQDGSGNPRPKRALNGRITFFPQNDYVAVVTYVNAEFLLQAKSASGHDLYREESNVIDQLTTQIAELKAEKALRDDKKSDAVGAETPSG